LRRTHTTIGTSIHERARDSISAMIGLIYERARDSRSAMIGLIILDIVCVDMLMVEGPNNLYVFLRTDHRSRRRMKCGPSPVG
jgi:hypothetical protein